MITSSKVLMGLIILFILSTVLLNMYQSIAMTTNTSVFEMITANTENITGTNPDTTGKINVAIMSSVLSTTKSIGDWINKYFLFDYAFFRDLHSTPNPVTGEYPFNDWVILRWMLVAIGAVVLLQLVISLVSLLPWFR